MVVPECVLDGVIVVFVEVARRDAFQTVDEFREGDLWWVGDEKMQVIMIGVDFVEAGFEVSADATEDRSEACEEFVGDHAVTILWRKDQVCV